MSTTTDALIDAVTREVLAALAGRGACDCSDPSCQGACAAHCSDKVRGVVSTGAERISYSGNGADVPRDLARFIDHTLLKPDATAADIDTLCEEARDVRVRGRVREPHLGSALRAATSGARASGWRRWSGSRSGPARPR